VSVTYKISRKQLLKIKSFNNKQLIEEVLKWKEVLYESPYKDALLVELKKRGS